MGKNKNYGNYFKKPQTEEPVKDEKIEEVQATEETAETSAEEAPVETPQSEEPIKIYGVVSGAKRVNMRKDPSKDAKVLTILEEGTRVEILKHPDRTWAKIMYKDLIGYMMYMYIRPED